MGNKRRAIFVLHSSNRDLAHVSLQINEWFKIPTVSRTCSCWGRVIDGRSLTNGTLFCPFCNYYLFNICYFVFKLSYISLQQRKIFCLNWRAYKYYLLYILQWIQGDIHDIQSLSLWFKLKLYFLPRLIYRAG